MYKKIISVMSVALVVFLCSSFPVFASSQGPPTRVGVSSTLFTPTGGTSAITSSLSLTSFNPIRTDFQYLDGYFRWHCDVLGYLVVFNNNDQDLQMSGNKFYYNIQQQNVAWENTGTSQSQEWQLESVDYIGGQLNVSYVSTSNEYVFELWHEELDGAPTNIIIPAHSNVCCYFKITYTCTIPNTGQLKNPYFTTSSVQLTRPTYYGGTLGNYHENYNSYIPDIYDALIDIYNTENSQLSVLQQILASYNSNVPASQSVTQDASDSSTVIGNQHQQESNIYSQTNQAIGSTGIQNFQFDSQTIGGLGGVKNDFMAVWNSLGTFNSIFITSLTIGLALSIVRHRRMFKQ